MHVRVVMLSADWEDCGALLCRRPLRVGLCSGSRILWPTFPFLPSTPPPSPGSQAAYKAGPNHQTGVREVTARKQAIEAKQTEAILPVIGFLYIMSVSVFTTQIQKLMSLMLRTYRYELGSFFYVWNRSGYSSVCFTCCQGIFSFFLTFFSFISPSSLQT